jgi:hypothetical protein
MPGYECPGEVIKATIIRVAKSMNSMQFFFRCAILLHSKNLQDWRADVFMAKILDIAHNTLLSSTIKHLEYSVERNNQRIFAPDTRVSTAVSKLTGYPASLRQQL